jgi:hypothetical protein
VLYDGSTFVTNGVREKIKIPKTGKVTVASVPAGMELYVQSTSPNRKLTEGFVLITTAGKGASKGSSVSKVPVKKKKARAEEDEDEGEEEEEEEVETRAIKSDKKPSKRKRVADEYGNPFKEEEEKPRKKARVNAPAPPKGAKGENENSEDEPMVQFDIPRPALHPQWTRVNWNKFESMVIDSDEGFLRVHWKHHVEYIDGEGVSRSDWDILESAIAALPEKKWKLWEKTLFHVEGGYEGPLRERAQWVSEDGDARLGFFRGGDYGMLDSIALEITSEQYALVISGSNPFLFASNLYYNNSDEGCSDFAMGDFDQWTVQKIIQNLRSKLKGVNKEDDMEADGHGGYEDGDDEGE